MGFRLRSRIGGLTSAVGWPNIPPYNGISLSPAYFKEIALLHVLYPASCYVARACLAMARPLGCVEGRGGGPHIAFPLLPAPCPRRLLVRRRGGCRARMSVPTRLVSRLRPGGGDAVDRAGVGPRDAPSQRDHRVSTGADCAGPLPGALRSCRKRGPRLLEQPPGPLAHTGRRPPCNPTRSYPTRLDRVPEGALPSTRQEGPPWPPSITSTTTASSPSPAS